MKKFSILYENNNKEKLSLYQTLKQSVLHFVKAETNSKEAKLNLIGGIVLIIYATIVCVDTLINKIIKIILLILNPNIQQNARISDAIISILLIPFYFLVCIKILGSLEVKLAKLGLEKDKNSAKN